MAPLEVKKLVTGRGLFEEMRPLFSCKAGIDNYIAGCMADGIEPHDFCRGTLNTRISPEMHGKIAMLAREAGTAINGYIKRALE